MSNWRVGSKVALNVYEGDRPMFQCHTPEEARRVVGLLSAVYDLQRKLKRATDAIIAAEQQADLAYKSPEPLATAALIKTGCILNTALAEIRKGDS